MVPRICAAALLSIATLPGAAETTAWRNGLWFNGTTFVADTRFTRDGAFVARRPPVIDRTVELGERFVVPAYGDAHHHGIDSGDALDDKITVFLEAGIFYVKNPNVIPELLTPEVRARLNQPDSIDVVFANGRLTSSGGHPARLHAYLASIGVFKGLKPEDMEDRAYFLIDDAAGLDAKWPRILAGKPDGCRLPRGGRGRRGRDQPPAPARLAFQRRPFRLRDRCGNRAARRGAGNHGSRHRGDHRATFGQGAWASCGPGSKRTSSCWAPTRSQIRKTCTAFRCA